MRTPPPHLVQVVREQHRVRQVRQAERRVAVGELLVGDHGSGGVKAAAAKLLLDGDAEEAEVTCVTTARNVRTGRARNAWRRHAKIKITLNWRLQLANTFARAMPTRECI